MTRRVKILVGAAAGVLLIGWLLTRNSAPEVVQATRRPATTGAPSAAPGASPAAGGAASATRGYDAYRLVRTRNVFDPDRRPARAGNAAPATSPPPARTDFVALTGTMFDAGKSLAFFSGSKAEYDRVLSLRDKIAGVDITAISPTGIEVERNGHKISVSVGQTVPMDATAAPGAAPAPDNFAAAPATVGSVASTASASPANASSSKQDDVRRRMEERRRQEQK